MEKHRGQIQKALLGKFAENTDRLSFLDVIKKLEKYIALDIANEWHDLRKIRNQLAHEYEDDPRANAFDFFNYPIINQLCVYAAFFGSFLLL